MKPDKLSNENMVAMTTIIHEREAHTTREGWTAEHDDQHADGELWKAAHFYVNTALNSPVWAYTNFRTKWPWDPEWFKPWKKDPAGNYTAEIDKERCLIKSGALILAEQERLERALQKVVQKLAEVQQTKA